MMLAALAYPPSGPRDYAPVIRLVPRATDSAALKALTRICPGSCFTFDAAERVAFSPVTCQGCGTCRRVCEATGEIRWGVDAAAPALV